MKFLFIGDLMCHDDQLIRMKFGDTFNFDPSYDYVKSTFERYDYVVVNLETVLTDGPYNGFPKFSSPKSFCGSAIKAGVNCFMLANNHISDRGVNGVKSTIDYLNSNDVLYTGVGTETHSKPVMIGNVAIINYTNFINVKVDGVSYNDLTDLKSIKDDIDYVKELGAKTIIAVVHWGKEYEPMHSRIQESEARQLVNLGVDIIIGSHPHVIQDVGYINGHPVIYSMGNFLSSQSEPECMASIGVEIETENDIIQKINLIRFNVEDENGILKIKESQI